METKKSKVVLFPEYKGDLSKLFDFENPVTRKEAFTLHKKQEPVVKRLSREFRKRYREELAR